MVTVLSRDSGIVPFRELTTLDLLRKRGAVQMEIQRLSLQLTDAGRRPDGREGNTPEWEAYRDWRGRARAALVHRRQELEDIKQLLRERADTGPAGNQLAREQHPERVTAAEAATEAAVKARREALDEALRTVEPPTLVLRAYRVLRHLLDGSVNSLPDTLDAYDRETLSLTSRFLRQTFGNAAVREFCSAEQGGRH